MRHSTLHSKETRKHFVIPTVTPLMPSIKDSKMRGNYVSGIDKHFYTKIIDMVPKFKASVSFNSLNFISEVAVLCDARFGSHPNALKVFLHNGKNNEVIKVKIDCKSNFLNNLESFMALQQYFEKIVSDTKAQSQTSLNEIGEKTLILPKVVLQDEGCDSRMSLNRFSFANTWFPDCFGGKFPVTEEQYKAKKGNVRAFINVSGLNVKLRPRRADNPLAKSTRDLQKNAISLRSEFLERIYPGIGDCVEIIADISGNIVIKPRQRKRTALLPECMKRPLESADIADSHTEKNKPLTSPPSSSSIPAALKNNLEIKTEQAKDAKDQADKSRENNSENTKSNNNLRILNLNEKLQCETKEASNRIKTIRKKLTARTSDNKRPISQESFSAGIVNSHCKEQADKRTLVEVASVDRPSETARTVVESKKGGDKKLVRIKCSLKKSLDDRKLKSNDAIGVKQDTRHLNLDLLNAIQIPRYTSNKEPTEILIYHTDYTHHANHIINKTIAGLNQFIAATFKNKDNTLDAKTVTQLSKTLSLELPVGKKSFTAQSFKDKELTSPFKERLLRLLSQVLNVENELWCAPKTGQYRFYISTRNNGVMVRSCLLYTSDAADE
eukprot:TRINITY_DN11076_c0_g1_i19.p1 TRINITY_DN11076_c0_g1~~TRINITY_DN11076_c0_g1_i19.p1  ORF type:complete len:611 (+),score=100.52 TRINITY_DN11076_c0_g1_i19:123-1955(+)